MPFANRRLVLSIVAAVVVLSLMWCFRAALRCSFDESGRPLPLGIGAGRTLAAPWLIALLAAFLVYSYVGKQSGQSS